MVFAHTWLSTRGPYRNPLVFRGGSPVWFARLATFVGVVEFGVYKSRLSEIRTAMLTFITTQPLLRDIFLRGAVS